MPHARSGADDLNLLQYFLIDVLAFIFGILFLVILTIWYVIKYTCKAFCWAGRKAVGTVTGGGERAREDKKKKKE